MYNRAIVLKSRWFATLVLIMILGPSLGSLTDHHIDDHESDNHPAHFMGPEPCLHFHAAKPGPEPRIVNRAPIQFLPPLDHYLSWTIRPELRPPMILAG